MRLRIARPFLVTTLVAAMLAAGVVPALAATGAPSRAGMRAAALTRLSRPLPAADPEIQERDLPVGGTVVDQLSYYGNFVDDWAVPLHGGQTLTVSIPVPAGMTLSVEIWGSSDEAEEPVAYAYERSSGTINLSYPVPLGTTGWHYIDVYADGGSGRYTMTYDFTDPTVTGVGRLAGGDRINTAIEISKSSYPAGAGTVVVATGWNFADALAASGLCGSYDAPLLLTRPSSLPAEVLTEIQRLGATKVFVLGSNRAVSDSVFAALQGGGRSVERIEGASRYETAANIARKIKQHEIAEGRTFTSMAFIINGLNFPDALSMAPYAFRRKIPVLPVLQNAIPAATADVLFELQTSSVVLAGSESVISAGVQSGLGPGNKQRVYGAGRTETAVAAANWAVNNGMASWDYVGIATGWNFPDALGGGGNVGKNNGVLLLSKPMFLNTTPGNALDGRNPTATKLYGSSRAISGCVIGDLGEAYDGFYVPWE